MSFCTELQALSLSLYSRHPSKAGARRVLRQAQVCGKTGAGSLAHESPTFTEHFSSCLDITYG